jgi:flagellar motor switch protein FliM
VLNVEFEYLNSELNPQFANIVGPTEVVVVSTFHVEFDRGGGDLHVTIPYPMIEPIRELLDAGIQLDRDNGGDDTWKLAMRKEVLDVEVDLHSTLVEKKLSLHEVLQLKPGDVIPVELPDEVLLMIDDVPVFRGKVGVSNANYALKIQNKALGKRTDSETPGIARVAMTRGAKREHGE